MADQSTYVNPKFGPYVIEVLWETVPGKGHGLVEATSQLLVPETFTGVEGTGRKSCGLARK